MTETYTGLSVEDLRQQLATLGVDFEGSREPEHEALYHEVLGTDTDPRHDVFARYFTLADGRRAFATCFTDSKGSRMRVGWLLAVDSCQARLAG
jgi:hypothetical protein